MRRKPVSEVEVTTNTCGDGDPCYKISDLRQLYEGSVLPIPVDTQPSTLFERTRKLFAEFLGTMLLLIVITGSGITAERLSQDVGLQLFENSVATACGLGCLIVMLGPISGAHFNPIVSLVDWMNGDMIGRDVFLYSLAQVLGAIAGTTVSNIQFAIPIEISTKVRQEHHLWIGEVIGTATLVLLIHSCVRTGRVSVVPIAVAAWVCGGIFFTSSTIFANPAVTIGRIFTNTFTGINPLSAAIFVPFQLVGGLVGYALVRLFYPQNVQMRQDHNLYLRVCVRDIESCMPGGGGCMVAQV
jgi:glycerol uptake facilitator-like aquaporin